MKRRKLLAVAACITVLCMTVTGCGKSTEANQDSEDETSQEGSQPAETNSQKAQELLTNISYATVEEGEADCKITFNVSKAECEGSGAVFEDGVLTISKAGCYEISGELEDGRIEVNASKDDKIQIVLNGVDISCGNYAPFVVLQADETVVYLTEGTTNTFSDGGTYYTATASGSTNSNSGSSSNASDFENSGTEEEVPSAAIFSKDDLGFTGVGTLIVKASCNDGITGKDDVWFDGGVYDITASDDGIVGKDSIAVKSGSFTIEAGGDGMKSTEDTDTEKGFITIENGTFAITAENDAIHSNNTVYITGGNLVIESGDDGVHGDSTVVIAGGTVAIEKCYEGIEGESIIIKGGKTEVTASDDGINAANGESEEGMDGPGGMGGQPGAGSSSTGSLSIEGGELYVNAGGDGLDANGSIYMSGGNVLVDGPVNDGNGTLDYDGEFIITGGTLAGAGSSGMMQGTSSNSTQGGMALSLGSSCQAGSEVVVRDSNGKEIIRFTPSKTFSAIVISSPELEVGESYEITVDGNSLGSVELSSVSVSNGGGQGGQGGNMGGGRRMR